VFTGIIQSLGVVDSVKKTGGDARLRIRAAGMDLSAAAIGDSIAVNGVCLTAIELGADFFDADCSRETLELTTLGDLRGGERVNLEKALTLGQPLGGHLVSGHVDGVGRLVSRREDARSVRLVFEMPAGLARYVARKGSICVDGVSLTVNEVGERDFGVNIVPHTLTATNLGQCQPGTRVNLEVDLIARYLERMILPGASQGGLGMEKLREAGFLKD